MNLIGLGVFGVIFLMLLAVVSNTSATSLQNIQDQMYLMNCPLPIYNGVATLTSIDGFALNYTIAYNNTVDSNGTFFRCSLDLLSNPHFNASAEIKEYGYTLFSAIPIGWLGYVADSLTVLWQRIYAFFTLVSFFVTPTNFNILGYTIADLAGIALMIVIGIYGLCYLFIGAMLYKLFSPFSGVT